MPRPPMTLALIVQGLPSVTRRRGRRLLARPRSFRIRHLLIIRPIGRRGLRTECRQTTSCSPPDLDKWQRSFPASQVACSVRMPRHRWATGEENGQVPAC
jgi:hypothetical protein